MTLQAEKTLQGSNQVKDVPAGPGRAKPGCTGSPGGLAEEEGGGWVANSREISATHTFPASLLVLRHTAPVGQRRTCLTGACQMEACFGPHTHTRTHT